MKEHVWVDSMGLELCDMVDTILHAEESLIIEFYHDKYLKDKELPGE